ncbi:MAG: GNAT family N-acetyltransferase [Gammaproteobacteria bacterium]|nr:GNAT family N-acetyltransferase [Gammaproteobacteria bacterium]
MLTIRSATNADVEPVRRLIFAVLAEYGLDPDPAHVDRDLDDIEATYLAGGGVFEVLLDRNRRIVGTVGLCPLDASRCELRKMYFAPEIRGQGWGKALLNRMIAKAQAGGFEEMVLETAGVLTEAIGLYQAFGFEPVAGDPEVARCDRKFRLGLVGYQPPELRALRRRMDEPGA